MPLYEFECRNNHWHEEIVLMGTTEHDCPYCEEAAAKIVSLPAAFNRNFIRANIDGHQTTFRYHDEYRSATRGMDFVGGSGAKDPPHSHVKDQANKRRAEIRKLADDKRFCRDTFKEARFNVRNGLVTTGA